MKMTNLTKQAIKKSCIKLLNERPYHKITVKDIVEDCGINRNSFYYHYQDLPSLIEEIIIEEADRIIQNYSRIETIEEGLNAAVSFALENKKAVLHIHNSASREIYEQYVWRVCEHITKTYIDTAFSDYNVPEYDKQIIIHFHKCECFGLIISWLNNGMKTDVTQLFHRLCEIRKGMTLEMFRRCEEKN